MSAVPDLHDRIVRVFSGSLNLDIPSDDTDLFESGVLDSLAFVELLLHLEREFGVSTSLDDLEIENFRSITRIVEFVDARTAFGAARSTQGKVVQLSSRR
jgi:methoxymalonate biosynthesis acyl carrier protein